MTNRLADETSPYLLQHAHNPVDWYPWGPEALARANAENKPILLSVGYSACHWCHVMERESFEDPATAALMNRDFVNIKVDREERPDVDEIYMRAVQAMNQGRGGWPMTVFLLPDGRPFWGGTYFPPEPRHGLPSFSQVLAEMARLFRESPDHVDRIGAEMADWLDRTSQMPEPQRTLRGDWLARVAAAGDEAFDPENGGLGGAPKFPPHGLLPVWLAHARVSGDAATLERLTRTLDAMARGGMYDQLAGGFARYSVDPAWRIPHFEKMLYDNGQLLPVYTDAWKVTGNPHYARVVRETVGWLLREMRLPCGAFAAATDADSEGEEGRYFCWTPAELDAVLGADGARAAELLQVTSYGTFEHGTSVLRLEEPLERLDPADRALLERSLPKLLAERSKRVPPARDDKVVTAWNGLAIGALARAGATFGEPAWIEAAERAATFLLEVATVDGRLMRTWKDDRAVVLGCADDHATLLAALLDLWEATFDQRWLLRANALADRLVALFWDVDGGGLFFTGSDAPALVTRSKHLNGGAEPSANEVAALAFVRLARLCGREDLGEKAAVILGGLQPTLLQVPRALGPAALAGHWWTQGGLEIGLAGDLSHGDGAALLAEVRRRHLPFAVVAGRRRDEPYALLPWLLGKGERGGPTAYVCEGHTCKLPASDTATLAEQLDASAQPRAPRSPVRVRAPELPTDPAAWLGSAPRSLASLRGNVVVLDFWTSCCANCHHVLPALAAVEARFAGEPVVVIGVHSAKFDAEKLPANAVAAVERLRIRHPVVLDPDHAVWSQYAIKSWPTIVVLDPTGRVAWDQPGEVSAEVLVERVSALLAEGRERGTLGEAVWRVEGATPAGDGLRFPGRVSTWARNPEDPWSSDVSLYVSDSGSGRVVEAALARGADGWPEVVGSRFVGGFVDPQGTARWRDRLYVADPGDQRVKTIDLRTGEVTGLAGSGELGRGGVFEAGKPLTIGLRSPVDVAVSGDEDSDEDVVVFVAMAGSHQVWLWMGEEGKFGVFAGTGREAHVDGALDQACFAQPSGIALHGTFAFVADAETSSLRAIDFQAQQVLTVFGAGLFDWGDTDGSAAEARAQHPMDVAAAGNTVYLADTYNGKLKAFDLHQGALRTVAEGFWEPGGVDVVGGFVVVADTNHHRVVVVEPRSGETRVLECVA